MATQKQAETHDSILDRLDEIDDALDEKETKEKIKEKPAPTQKEKNQRYLKFLLFAGLGVCVGLSANAIFANRNVFDSSTSNGPKEQRDYTDEEAAAIYDTLSTHAYTYGGSSFTSKSTLASFQKDGWVIQADDVMPVELEPGAEFKCKLVKGSYVIQEASITNNSKINYTTADVPLDQMEISDTTQSVVGPYEIQIGMSKEEVAQIFKDNNLPYEYTKYSYSSNYSSYVSRYTTGLPYLHANIYVDIDSKTDTADYISYSCSTGISGTYDLTIYKY